MQTFADPNAPTVLVIDDEAGPRLSLRLILEQRFRVIAVSSAEDGLTILESEPVGLVTLDLNMPGLGGSAALRRMRELGMDVPVIIVTGFGSSDHLRHALQLRAFDFISKPFDASEIVRVADAALARRPHPSAPGAEYDRTVPSRPKRSELDCLLEVTRRFSASPTGAQMLDDVTNSVQSALGAGYRIAIVESGDGSALPAIASEALKEGRPAQSPQAAGSRSQLALPIRYAGEPLGALLVEADRGGRAFEPAEVEICQVIANAAALALDNVRKAESLLDSERAKSDFLGNLSHELRTPLNAVLGFSELARERAAQARNPELDDMIARIARAGADLYRQVDGLLRLSRATLGREHKRMGRVDVPAMLRRVVDLARRQVAATGPIDVHLRIDGTIPELYTDADKLERIVQLLALNAIKFTPRGWVRIAAALSDAASHADLRLPNGTRPWERILSVRVEDSGIGIEATDLGKIFEAFRQASTGLARRYGGLGVGLTLAHQLTEILGGAIRVESAVDQGSSFEVFVPVHTATEA